MEAYKKLHGYFNLANLNLVIFRIIVAGILLPISISAQETLTNLHQLENSVLSLVDSVAQVLSDKESGIKIEYGAVGGERKGFLNQLLIGYFKQEGISVNREEAAYEIYIEQFEPSFVYKQQSGALLGISDRFDRKTMINMTAWLQLVDGEVLSFIKTKKTVEDQIRESDLPGIESGPYLFLRGKKVVSSLWSRVFEPTIVIISVSTVVYLFFTMRS